MKFKIAFIIVFFIIPAKSECFVDEYVAKFRQDYRNFHKESFKSVDRSFFYVYSTVNSTLWEIYHPFVKTLVIWKKLCGKLKKTKLNKTTKNRVKSVCNDIQNEIEKLIFERNESLMMFFSGDISSMSPAGEVLEKLFFHMELQLSQIWQIYSKNCSCVGPILKEYLPSFEILKDNICFMSNQTISNINLLFFQVKVLFTNANDPIMNCIMKIDECLKNKKQQCFQNFVSTYLNTVSRYFKCSKIIVFRLKDALIAKDYLTAELFPNL